MNRAITVLLTISLMVLASACSDGEPASFDHLEPYDNPFGPDDPRWEPQPQRLKPMALQLCADTSRLFVALPGSVDAPDSRVAVVDVEQRTVTDFVEIGQAPYALALHPDGHHLVVANRFSNFLSIIDLDDYTTRRRHTDFYIEGLLFDADGHRLFAANRRHNTVELFRAATTDGTLQLTSAPLIDDHTEIPVGFNPRKLTLAPDEQTLYVASPEGLIITAVDLSDNSTSHHAVSTASPVEVDVDASLSPPSFASEVISAPGTRQLWLGSPPFDLITDDRRIYAATLSDSTHHPPGDDDGDDDAYTPPTGGSPNEGFQDLQNEIAVIQRGDYAVEQRYTSASYCCPDVHDVSPDAPDRGHLVPDESLRIVEGALPVAIDEYESPDGSHLLVAYGGSGEVQRFDLDDGQLAGGPSVSVGFDPRDIAVDPRRQEAFVANRLSDTISVVDLQDFDVTATIELADDATPAFPATDAELGELFFYAGAEFSIGGAKTCNHCHFDRGNIGKFFQMPQFDDPRASRMTTDTRGLYDTRPWFLEGVVDEQSPDIELHQFAHPDNFCCEDHPDPDACAAEPPPDCDEPPFSKRAPTRDGYFQNTAEQLVDRRHSFGEAVDADLDFDGVTRLIGLYLIHRPGLLPNPNRADTDAARRGRHLFESPKTGCAVCHPAPAFGVSTDVNPFETPLLFAPVIEPARDTDGTNLNRLSNRFLSQYPEAVQKSGDVYYTSPSLRGLWDRAGGFFHHGRARTLREALATPGHPAIDDDQTGYNIADGVFDAHGATGHLTDDELDDLIEFILTM